MAKGFGNAAGAVTFASWGGLTNTEAQTVTGAGWTAAVGDITPIGQADDLLREKVVSGRHDPIPITVPYLFDPNSTPEGTHPTSTASGLFTMTYPGGGGNDAFAMTCGMTSFKYGDMLDDDVMVGECEFMPLGGIALDDTYTA